MKWGGYDGAMKKRFRLALVVLVLGVIGLLGYCALGGGALRPMGPPEGVTVSIPFGAIDIDDVQTGLKASALERSLVESMRTESPQGFDPGRDGVRRYQVLAISGGGSNGAFGSGFMNGWTASGTRPDFNVVTGVSTGAFQALFVFLGPDYDPMLKDIYTIYTGDHIAVKRSPLAALFNDSTWDLSPLGEVIQSNVTDELLAAVAAKHEAGYRLYVGTTNLDTAEFVIWDMGLIAASGRPGAREHFVRILLASASVPVLFPPVYFEVEGDDGNTYFEMHVDGSTFSQVFFRGFLLEIEDAVEILKPTEEVNVKLYIIRNGKLEDVEKRSNVKASVPSIAGRTIESLFKITLRASLYRMYVLARKYDIDVTVAAIPDDFGLDRDPLLFEDEGLRRLYDLGYLLGSEDYQWIKSPPKLDPSEVIKRRTG